MRNPIYILFTILLLTSCSGGGSRSNEQSHNDNVASNPTYDYESGQLVKMSGKI